MDLNKPLILLFLLSFISTLPILVQGSNCSISKCGEFPDSPNIRFPFRVKNSGQQPNTCGHLGFDVWCDGESKYTLIELPSSGNFRVKNIDYAAQEIWINDPNKCLPKRLLTFNLSSSPFTQVYNQYFSFYNCSKTFNDTKNHNIISTNITHIKGLIGPIKCLSGTHYFVYATPIHGTINNHTSNLLLSPLNCSIIAPLVKVPVQWPPLMHRDTAVQSLSELHEDLRLSWYMPECRSCEVKGKMCGLETNNTRGSYLIICSDNPKQGKKKVGKLPLTTFIVVIVVICSASIICLLGSIFIWFRACFSPRRSIRSLQSESRTHHGPPHVDELGLVGVNIEFARQIVRLGLNEEANPDYKPNILISEIDELGQSPNRENPNISTCAICMGEYKRKDRIGTLPTCEHYFHAICINKWLLSSGIFGKTCPICRAPVDSS